MLGDEKMKLPNAVRKWSLARQMLAAFSCPTMMLGRLFIGLGLGLKV